MMIASKLAAMTHPRARRAGKDHLGGRGGLREAYGRPRPPYTDAMTPPAPLTGHLWVFVAFDWGDEIYLGGARRLAAGAAAELPRRPRTPSSFTYRPPPVRFGLEA